YKDSTMIVTAFACVYVSKDLGQTWEKHLINQPEAFEIQIISRDTIFISSVFPDNPTHAFLSTDRGTTWQPINPGIIIKSFFLFNSKEGLATSYDGLYKTMDGGLTWTIPDSTAPALGQCIRFRTRANGFIFGQGDLWTTVDSGAHWVASASQVAANINSIEFVNDNTLVAVGDDGLILRSTDNGVTWTGVSTGPADAYGLYSACFIDSSIGFAVGHRGRILKTTNGGSNWNQYAPTYVDVDALHFINDSTGLAATWNNIYKTTDSGTSWVELSQTLSGTIRYIHLFSKDTAIVMSDPPVTILKTYNGGANWQPINLNILYNDEILTAFFLNQTIYLSTNGFLGRRILQSTDAGETWKVQYTSPGYDVPYFINLFFTDEKTGYGIYGYTVYKTTDSAKTWAQSNMLPSQLLRSLWFVNDSVGYAVGDQSCMTQTSDSGHTWTQLHIDPTNWNVPGDLKQVKFFDQKIGFIINGRNVYRTIDSGNHWTLHGTPGWDLNGIEIVDTTLYLYGIYGSILKRSIKTYEIDSLAYSLVTNCSSNISATVSAVFSAVDSVWFEYGTSDYDSAVVATPTSIDDTSLKVTAALTALLANTNYIARVKLLYEGNYYYSNSITFITESQFAPSISLNGGKLYSSAPQGNQWYVDGTPIPGATQSSYTPTQSGNYTVTATIGNCSSGMSAPFSYILTAVNDPLLLRAINIFPNPVTNTLNVQNNDLKNLQIKIFNVLGVEVGVQLTSKKENTVDMRRFPQGTYMVNITDTKTLKSIQKLVVKL
ncbi:MAG TPA: YCF48-related protein, partial [Chitinophagaceae bacterium]|nr:YCF48-related protein [Chitinophagaceae bacterium]